MIWMLGNDLMAQCSQCKAAASSADDEGNLFFGQDLNFGVLYLLALPVFLPILVGGIWYYKVRKGRKQEELQTALDHRSVNNYLD